MSRATKLPSSGIIYRGPSMIDGTPIVVIALWSTANAKTGGMLQTYILADNGQSPPRRNPLGCRCVHLWRLQASW